MGNYAAITDEIKGRDRVADGRRSDGQSCLPNRREKLPARKWSKTSVAALDMAGRPCTDYEQADCRVLS